MDDTLIEVVKLRKYYSILGGVFKRKVADVQAVDDVNLCIPKGKCFGLVGESGCGKTTLGKTIIRLLEPTAGSIFFDVPSDIREEMKKLLNSPNPDLRKLRKLRKEYDIATFKRRKLKRLRRVMQIVYQDPSLSLNPRMLVKDTISEPLKVQRLAKGRESRERVLQILQIVGLTDKHLYRYPHEFSGGQRQRIAIARAIITNPRFVILDEPTSSVDVSVRAELLKEFQRLQKELDLTYLFISHDLSVVECIADTVAVMYLGKIVEIAETRELFRSPLHPYTSALFSSIPIPDPDVKRKRVLLKGEVPSPVNPPIGCRFHPRCPKAMDICRKEEPRLLNIQSKGEQHLVACHLFTGR